jgi:hypothetical protein
VLASKYDYERTGWPRRAVYVHDILPLRGSVNTNTLCVGANDDGVVKSRCAQTQHSLHSAPGIDPRRSLISNLALPSNNHSARPLVNDVISHTIQRTLGSTTSWLNFDVNLSLSATALAVCLYNNHNHFTPALHSIHLVSPPVPVTPRPLAFPVTRANSHHFRQDLLVDRLLKGNIPRGLRSNRLRKLRRRCRGRWPSSRTRTLGYRRTGGLRSSQTPLLSRLACRPYLLCYRLARLARERAGKGMIPSHCLSSCGG